MPLSRSIIMALSLAFLSMAGVFVTKTFADTIFLAEFGATYLPHFITAQAIGIVATSAGYGWLLRRAPALTIDLTILGGFAASALAGLWAVRAGGAAVFAVTLALSVLGALAYMVLWNAATAVVSGRRSRRFLPLAGAASTAGAVVGSFGSTAVVGGFAMAGLAPVIAVMALGSAVLRVLLVSRSGEWRTLASAAAPRTRALAEQTLKIRKRPATQAAPPEVNPDLRLVRILAVATVVEACLTAFVDFGFKREVVSSIVGRDAIGLFFSLFYGLSNAALLGLQVAASSRLLATRSLRFSLAFEPAVLFLTSAAWAVFPTLAFAAAARGAESVMKFGIARPAQEVALTPLTEVERKRWKVLLRGVYNQAGGAGAGILLIVAAPWLASHSTALPAAAALTALVWLTLQLAASNRYLDT